jgi:hypothetical protein
MYIVNFETFLGGTQYNNENSQLLSGIWLDILVLISPHMSHEL